MKKLALAVVSVVLVLLPTTAAPADAHAKPHHPAIQRAIDWD